MSWTVETQLRPQPRLDQKWLKTDLQVGSDLRQNIAMLFSQILIVKHQVPAVSNFCSLMKITY